MLFRALTVLSTVALVASLSTSAKASELTVSAASSLQQAMTEIAKAYETATKDKVTINFGASGALAAQIQQGAPVDVFVSAADKPVDDLMKAGKLVADTRLTVASNALVLVVPVGKGDAIKSFEDLAGDIAKKIAVGEPKTVPAGQYAMESFQALKLANAQFDAKLVYGANVRQVLTYVETANVDAGVVYATDALPSTKVRVVAEAKADWHKPIIYPAAVVKATKSEASARALVTFLGSAAAQKILTAHGFKVEPSKS